MERSSNVSIIPTEFRETGVGKTFSASKIRAEFHLLLNYKEKVCIEVVNSRFSRKKVIAMNGEPVSKFNKMSVVDLRWNWSYIIDGESIEFNVEPNTSGTGVDLKINGRDFFDYVIGVLNADATGADRTNDAGLARLNTSIIFKVPPNFVTGNTSRKSSIRSNEALPPVCPPNVDGNTVHDKSGVSIVVAKESNESNRTSKLPNSSKYVHLRDDDPLIDL